MWIYIQHVLTLKSMFEKIKAMSEDSLSALDKRNNKDKKASGMRFIVLMSFE